MGASRRQLPAPESRRERHSRPLPAQRAQVGNRDQETGQGGRCRDGVMFLYLCVTACAREGSVCACVFQHIRIRVPANRWACVCIYVYVIIHRATHRNVCKHLGIQPPLCKRTHMCMQIIDIYRYRYLNVYTHTHTDIHP